MTLDSTATQATNRKQKPIYLDYQASTPCDPRVVEAMLPFFTEYCGNPHARTHVYGWTAEEAVESARAQIAQEIHADPREIIFTSGATEANNLAIKGTARFYEERGSRHHILTSQIEHDCVLESCRFLEKCGFSVTYLPVQSDGIVDLKLLRQAITEKTLLVSIMAANNEIGVLQPLADIGAICRERGVFFHTDAAQALGKIPLDVHALSVDLMSLSSHKIYGPKGIGALYCRLKPRVSLEPLLSGGGQERGLRSGTVAVPLCVGFGEACRIAGSVREEEGRRLLALRKRLYTLLCEGLPEIYLNGHPDQRLPGNLNISFAGVEGEGILMGAKDLALSTGSACNSLSLEPSHVLAALGVDPNIIHGSVRISLGRFTTEEEVDQAAASLIASVRRLREMSPLWENKGEK
ncbi:MAG: IscS subfamily cysteine desulfurase [Holosporales bacterium]|jgi:cysteine desulfurase|nr:IscS subfamily cysteine desulfurase [Holosporales bacterium]